MMTRGASVLVVVFLSCVVLSSCGQSFESATEAQAACSQALASSNGVESPSEELQVEWTSTERVDKGDLTWRLEGTIVEGGLADAGQEQVALCSIYASDEVRASISLLK